jgi:hypothetical protein
MNLLGRSFLLFFFGLCSGSAHAVIGQLPSFYKNIMEGGYQYDNYSTYDMTSRFRRSTSLYHIRAIEFEDLIVDLAPRIDVFADVLEVDPNAQLYGEAIRDLAYWVFKQAIKTKTQQDWIQLRAELYAIQRIAARDFLNPESKLQFIVDRSNLDRAKFTITPETYGLTNLTFLGREAFLVGTKQYARESKKGSLPLESFRISAFGIQRSGYESLGDLLYRIPSIHFPITANRTVEDASDLEDYPIWLVLRYLRLLTIDYTAEYGGNQPVDLRKILDRVLEINADRIKGIVTYATNGLELQPALNYPHLNRQINQMIRQTIVTNPGLADQLFKYFGIYKFISAYRQLQRIPSYITAVRKDPTRIHRQYEHFHTTNEQLLTPLVAVLPHRLLYHDAQDYERFHEALMSRAISLNRMFGVRGVFTTDFEGLPSGDAVTGPDLDYMVEILVTENARLIDITQGEGLRVFTQLRDELKDKTELEVLDMMADQFGADVIRFQRNGKTIYALKNAAAIESTSGLRLKIKPLTELVAEIGRISTADDIRVLLQNVRLNRYHSKADLRSLAVALRDSKNAGQFARIFRELAGSASFQFDVFYEDFCTNLSKPIGQMIYNNSRSSVTTLTILRKLGLLQSPELIGQIRVPENRQSDFDTIVPQLRAAHFKVDEIVASLRIFGIMNEHIDRVIREALPDVKSASEAARILVQAVPFLSDQTPQALDYFFTLAPTITDIKALEEVFQDDVHRLLKLWEQALGHVQTADEFLELMRRPQNLGTLDANRINAFFLKQMAFFLSKNPTAQQVKQFQVSCISSLHDSIELMNSSLRNRNVVKTAADYLELAAAPPRASGPERLGFDDLVQKTLHLHTSNNWTSDDFQRLIELSVVSPETLTTVWRLAAMAIAQSPEVPLEEKSKQFVRLLAKPLNMPSRLFQEALNQFLMDHFQQLIDLGFEGESFTALLRTPDIEPDTFRTIFETVGAAQSETMNLESTMALVKTGSVNVRLGFQKYVADSFATLFIENNDPHLWLQVLRQVDLPTEDILQIAYHILGDPNQPVSRVFELLQILANSDAKVDVLELFWDRFANMPPETVNRALTLQLSNRHRAYVMLLSYSQATVETARWLDGLTAAIHSQPILAREIYRILSLRRTPHLPKIPIALLGITPTQHVKNRCRRLLEGVL